MNWPAGPWRSCSAAPRRPSARTGFVCSDSGVPVYVVEIGTAVRMEGDLKRAISDGFAASGRDDRAAHPQARHQPADQRARLRGQGHADHHLGPGRRRRLDRHHLLAEGARLGPLGGAGDLHLPSLETIETYVMDCVMKAGSQHCPPVVIGVGIGGTFDHCAKIAKQAALRPFGADQPGADPGRDGGPAAARGEQDRLRPDGHRRRHHRAGRARRIRRRATASRRSPSASIAGSTAAPAPASTTTAGWSGWSERHDHDTHRLTLPLSEAAVRKLRAGDLVDAGRRDDHHRRAADASAHPGASRRGQGAAGGSARRRAVPPRQLQPRHATARSRCCT